MEPRHDWLVRAAGDGAVDRASVGLFHGAPALAFALHTALQPGYAPARRVPDEGSASSSRTGSQRPIVACTRRTAAAGRIRPDQRADRPRRPPAQAPPRSPPNAGNPPLPGPPHRPDRRPPRLVDPVAARPHRFLPAGRPRQQRDGARHHRAARPARPYRPRRSAVVGQTEAIGRICAWFDDLAPGPRGRPWWPETVSLATTERGT